MITKKHAAILALAACSLLIPCALSAKDKVERPFKIQGQGTIRVNLIDASYEATESGRATHTGFFTDEYSGFFNLETFMFASATGVLTAPNGDRLFWEELPDQPHVVYMTGGTGRFTGATGTFTYTTTDLNSTVDLNSMTITITYNYSGSGIITY